MTMRYRNLGAAGLALALGLGIVGIGLGQQPAGSDASWFSRLFGRTTPASEAKDSKEVKVVPAVSPAKVRAQAEANYMRRLEVCDKLREVAMQNGDQELLNRVDQLQTRAKDAYVQRTNRLDSVPDSFDEQSLAKNLAPKTGSLTPLTTIAGKSTNAQASAEGGR
jgi:hypothetical protein